jgi:hypothetical protein
MIYMDSDKYLLLHVKGAPGHVAGWFPAGLPWGALGEDEILWGCADVEGELIPVTFAVRDVEEFIDE